MYCLITNICCCGPMCSMCARIGAPQGLRTVFRDYIRSAGSAIVMDEHKASFPSILFACISSHQQAQENHLHSFPAESLHLSGAHCQKQVLLEFHWPHCLWNCWNVLLCRNRTWCRACCSSGVTCCPCWRTALRGMPTSRKRSKRVSEFALLGPGPCLQCP